MRAQGLGPGNYAAAPPSFRSGLGLGPGVLIPSGIHRFAALAAIAIASYAAPSLADAGSFERGRSTHFLLLYDLEFEHRTGSSGSSRFERQVLESLELSYRALDQLLGIAPRRRVDVVVHDASRFDRELAWRFRFPSAGFYGQRIHVRGTPQVNLQLEAVLAHELVHAALDQEAPSLSLPGWINEGVATWFESQRIGKRGLNSYERSMLIAASRQGGWLDLARLSTPTFASFHAGEAHIEPLDGDGEASVIDAQ